LIKTLPSGKKIKLEQSKRAKRGFYRLPEIYLSWQSWSLSMTELQIILLVCAFVFVGALYWWGKKNDDQSIKRPFKHGQSPAQTPEEENYGVVPVTPASSVSAAKKALDRAMSSAMAIPSESIAVGATSEVAQTVSSMTVQNGNEAMTERIAYDGNVVHATAAAQGASESVHPTHAPAKEVDVQIFALLVLSPSRELTRMQIHTAMEASRLSWQAQEGVYAHLDAAGQVVFQVANVVEPGYFPAIDAAEFTTPGVALVLNLPTSITPYRAMDEFITVARKLNQSLNGKLYDAHRHVIKESDLRAMRDYAQSITY
jgi:FtsZ-interacting cell division protein ZipA